MDKRFKLLFIILCFAISAFAQQFSVSGRVTDADGHPLDFANVFIVAPGDKIEASAVCDVDGKFKMTVSAGKCMLGCTFIGYEMYQNVIDLNSDIDVGDIKMQQSATELQTVVVQGRLMSVRMQKDGYSVDVSKINNDFNNALDLMRCIPQVQVKDNELKVAGKQQVLVKIGNVVQRVETSELPDVLKGYDARLVERVEVLRQPPLRYDKDGNTAMIVLHTTPAFSKYFGGIIGTEEMKGENYNFRYGGFGQLMYNTEKMFLSVAPSANWNGSYMKESAQYDYGSYLYKNVSPSKGDNNYAGVRGTLQWSYSKNGLLGLTGGFNKRSIDNVFVSSDWAEPQTNGVVDAKSNNTISFRTPKKTVTAYMEQTLGRPESKMWLETSYYDYTEKQNSDYVSLSVKDGKKFFTYNDKDCLKVRGVGVNNDYSLLLDTTAHNTTFDFGARAPTKTVTTTNGCALTSTRQHMRRRLFSSLMSMCLHLTPACRHSLQRNGGCVLGLFQTSPGDATSRLRIAGIRRSSHGCLHCIQASPSILITSCRSPSTPLLRSQSLDSLIRLVGVSIRNNMFVATYS